MSKRKDKEKQEEFLSPNAKILYDAYVKIITEYGAIEGERSHSGGSKRSFTITVGDQTIPFVIHEPHRKKGYVGRWDHQNVLYIFKYLGLIKDKEAKDEKEKK